MKIISPASAYKQIADEQQAQALIFIEEINEKILNTIRREQKKVHFNLSEYPTLTTVSFIDTIRQLLDKEGYKHIFINGTLLSFELP